MCIRDSPIAMQDNCLVDNSIGSSFRNLEISRSNFLLSFFFVSRYHNNRMINHDRDRDQAVELHPTHSTLTLPHVDSRDSGNYTCSPHNLSPSSVVVHILDEDSNSAAAIHTDDGGSISSRASSALEQKQHAMT